MEIPRCALRFHCRDTRVGMDPLLARVFGRGPDRDCLTCEVSEGTSRLRDSAFRVAFLDGLRGTALGSSVTDNLVDCSLVRREALSGRHVPQDIACWQSGWRDEVVPESRLSTCGETQNVCGRVPPVLFARSGIDRSVAQPFLVVARYYSGDVTCCAGCIVMGLGECHCRWGGLGVAGTGARPDSAFVHSYHRR